MDLLTFRRRQQGRLDEKTMSKVTLRVKHAGGQGVVRGLELEDSIEKLISHSLEALGIPDDPGTSLRLLAGFPPKVSPAQLCLVTVLLFCLAGGGYF